MKLIAQLLLITLAVSALTAQPTGPIRPGGPSPRIEALTRQLAKDGAGAVDEFWAALAREHTPIVEAFPNDRNQVLLTLVWRGGPQTKSVRVAGSQMERISSTDVWYATFAVASSQRLAYSFQTDDHAGRQPDPLNPHRFVPPVPQERPVSAISADSPYMNNSIAVLPGAPAAQWVDPQPGVAAGRVEEHSYASKASGHDRRVWIYHPPGDAPSDGLLICLWGKDYLNEIPVPTILDNLLSQHRIPRLTALFVDGDGDRFQDFQHTQKIAEMLATELIPWIRTKEKLPADPRRTTIAGYSASGLAATYVAFKHPELVGNVLSQSGAFWRGFEGEGALEYEWLTTQYSKSPKQSTRFYLHVGGREDRHAGGSGPVFKEANSRLRDALVKRGYTVSYEEVEGAEHEFIHWRSKFADGLIYLTSSSSR